MEERGLSVDILYLDDYNIPFLNYVAFYSNINMSYHFIKSMHAYTSAAWNEYFVFKHI